MYISQYWYTVVIYVYMCWVIARLSDGGSDGPQTKPGSTDGKSAVAWKLSGPRSTSGRWHLWVFCAAEWIVKRWLCRARLSLSTTAVTGRFCPNPVGCREVPGCISSPSHWALVDKLHSYEHNAKVLVPGLVLPVYNSNYYIIPILKSPNL